MPATGVRDGSSDQQRYSRRKTAEEAEIGDIPPVADRRARHFGEIDPVFFAMHYFPDGLGQAPLSVHHCGVIDTIDSCFRTGGQYGQAIFRGFAKTSVMEVMVLRAILYGHRRFIPLIGSDDITAKGSLDTILQFMEQNEELQADFPEVCYPIAKLERKHQRTQSQTFRGEPTRMETVASLLQLPTIKLPHDEAERLGIPVDERGFTLSTSARIQTFGILSYKRGLKYVRGDGRIQRVDAVAIDDFQTDASARSPAQVNTRLGVIRQAVLRSGSHQKAMACVINGTIITPDDGMSRLMDRKLFANFRTRTVPMLLSRATEDAEKHWFGEYADLMKSFDDDDDDSKVRAQQSATEYYREHRQEMDAGAEAAWHNAYSVDDHEISAIQHAYNIFVMEGEDVFLAECQQTPVRPEDKDDDLKASDIIAKANGLPRRSVPLWADMLTAFIDVQDKALYWLVAAWGQGFKGQVIDYGMFPEQSSRSLSLADCKFGLRHKYKSKNVGIEGAIRAGLDELTDALLSREFEREEDHVRLSIQRLAIDSADNTTTVYEAIRRNPRKAQIMPSKGRYVGPASAPWETFKKKPGEQINRQYRFLIATTAGSRDLRLLQHDVNWWKSFVHNRLGTADGDAACVSLFGVPQDHTQFAAQILAEYRTETTGPHGKVDVWKIRPHKPDNHMLDCLVGASAVAASLGMALAVNRSNVKEKKPRRSLAELQRSKRGGR